MTNLDLLRVCGKQYIINSPHKLKVHPDIINIDFSCIPDQNSLQIKVRLWAVDKHGKYWNVKKYIDTDELRIFTLNPSSVHQFIESILLALFERLYDTMNENPFYTWVKEVLDEADRFTKE